MQLLKYYLAAISAFAIWGFFSLVLKPLDNHSSLDILFYRVFFCAVIMIVINLVFRRKSVRRSIEYFNRLTSSQKRSIVFLNLAGGLFLTANWFLFIYVTNQVNIKAASFAYMICPIITTLLGFLLLNEKLTFWQWLAVALSSFSCVLLSLNNLSDVLYSLTVAASYACYLVSQRKNTFPDRFLALSFQIIFSSLLLLPFFPKYGSTSPMEIYFYWMILVIAVLFTILPLFLNLFSLQRINSSTAGMLLYINPVIGFVLAIYHYHEGINYYQVISYSIILISIVIFNVSHLTSKRVPQET